MKKILYNIILLLGVLVLYSSCSNSDYDEKNFYSSRYHKILLFKDSGKISLALSTPQTDYQDSMVVFKAGSNPKLTADVHFKILTQSEVDSSYNAIEGMDYRVIPSEDYSFNNGDEMTFESGETGKYLVMTIHADKIYDYVQSATNVTAKTKFVLPLQMVSQNDTINTDKGYVFKMITVAKPEIKLAGNMYPQLIYQDSDYQISPKVNNYVPDRDFTCTLTESKKDSLVKAFQDSHPGYTCQAMPTGAYTLPTLTFTKGNVTGSGLVHVDRKLLTSDVHYVLPLQIESTTLPAASINTHIQYLVVTPPTACYEVVTDRSNWKILFCNNAQKFWTGSSGNDNDGPVALIDGKTSTYWHCNYWGCWPEAYQGQDQTGKNTGHALGDDYLYYFKDFHAFAAKRYANQTVIVMDMGKVEHVIGVGFMQRQSSAFDTKSFDTYVSNDSEFKFLPLESGGSLSDYNDVALNNWTFVCSINTPQQNATSYAQASIPTILSGGVKGRYVKIHFTGTNRGQILAGAEFYVIRLLSINGVAPE
jgi:hypothetical protein